MPEKSYPMTAEGKEKLQAELKNLKLVKRPEVIQRIKVARSFGDLSENSEYDAAKDEQSHVEDRIAQVEDMLKYAQVVDADSVDPLNGKISNDSPIAQALLGKKKGETVSITTPGGQFDVVINKVEA